MSHTSDIRDLRHEIDALCADIRADAERRRRLIERHINKQNPSRLPGAHTTSTQEATEQPQAMSAMATWLSRFFWRL